MLWFKILVDLLVYCAIYFTLVDFQAISLNLAYVVCHLILPTINNAKVGSCDTGQTWARHYSQ
jgi:hypothetical protein